MCHEKEMMIALFFEFQNNFFKNCRCCYCYKPHTATEGHIFYNKNAHVSMLKLYSNGNYGVLKHILKAFLNKLFILNLFALVEEKGISV